MSKINREIIAINRERVTDYREVEGD